MIGREVAPGDWEVKALVGPRSSGIDTSVVGVLHFQPNLKVIHTIRGDKRNAEFLLIADPSNPFDPESAVRVYAIDKRMDKEDEPNVYLIGYLSKKISKGYYDLIVKNEIDGIYVRGIVGWWDKKSIYWAKLDLAPVKELERRIVK